MAMKWINLAVLVALVGAGMCCAEKASVVAPGAKVEKLAGGFKFTEGPTPDAKGDVYFSDIPNNRIHKWDVAAKKLSTFREESGGANGLYFDKDGSLLACQGSARKIVSIDAKAKVTVLADAYGGKGFNRPNDLWLNPKGGIYFSDPMYGRGAKAQDGEHVYYLKPDRKTVIRVIDDMVRPNGLIGTPDGKTLYVTDHGGKKTFRYTVKADGRLADKTLFAPIGSDGMTMDSEGNVYMTESAVVVYSAAGKEIARIAVPQRPSNVCFGGKDGRTLFITARKGFYSIRMRVGGAVLSSRL